MYPAGTVSIYRHYGRVSVGGAPGVLLVFVEAMALIVVLTVAVALVVAAWLLGAVIYLGCRALLRFSDGERGGEWIEVGRALMRQPRRLASSAGGQTWGR